MARTELALFDMPGPFMTVGTIFTWTAADVANGNKFPTRGDELVVVRNTDSGAHNVTITSVADPLGRTGTVTEAIAAGATRMYGPFTKTGWMQLDGFIYLSADSATVVFVVLRMNEWAKTS